MLYGDCGMGESVGSRSEVVIGIKGASKGDERGTFGMPGVAAGDMFGEDTTTVLLC